MPGSPRLGYRRVTPLREIGLRMLRPRGNYMTTTAAGPGGVNWASCAPQAIKPAAKAQTASTPEYIFLSAVTVIKVPMYTKFSKPCE